MQTCSAHAVRQGVLLNSDMHMHPCILRAHAAILYSGGKSPLPSTFWDMGTPVADSYVTGWGSHDSSIGGRMPSCTHFMQT